MKYTIKIWSPYANNYFITFNYSNVDTIVDIDKGIVSGSYICIYNIEFIYIGIYVKKEHMECTINLDMYIDEYWIWRLI